MRTNKNTPKIALAITVALLATLISYSTFSSMRKQVEEQKKLIDVMQQTSAQRKTMDFAYAVATKELKTGEMVSEEDVDFKNFTTENPAAFENRSDVVNKVLLKNIMPGEIFTSAHIAKISSDNIDLREGYRALTLPADNFQGKSKSMHKGSVIDIYSASSDSNWFLEGVRILGFESNRVPMASDGKAPDVGILDATSISFEVPVTEVSDFISNISKNKMVLVTRSNQDLKVRRVVKKTTPTYSDFNISAKPNIKSLPAVPSSLPTLGSSISDLPSPIQPTVQGPSVEVIEANVKSKVTFD